MKKLLSVLLLASGFLWGESADRGLKDHEKASDELVMEYMKVVDDFYVFDEFVRLYKKELKETIPNLPPNFFSQEYIVTCLKDYKARLIRDTVSVYKANIPKNDLQELIALYKTDVGKKAIKYMKINLPSFDKNNLDAYAELDGKVYPFAEIFGY